MHGAPGRSTARPSAQRLIRRHRRGLAGVAAAASIAALGLAVQPHGPATRAVVVAAIDLPTGRSLVAGDLAVAQVPAGVLPAGTSTDAGDLLGRVLSAPLARGEAVAEHRLTALPTWSVPPGTMPIPVRFADPGAAALLTAGQRVDVVAASGSGPEGDTPFMSAELVAQDVLVLAVISADPGSEGMLADRQTPRRRDATGAAGRRPWPSPGHRRGAGTREPGLPHAPRDRLTPRTWVGVGPLSRCFDPLGCSGRPCACREAPDTSVRRPTASLWLRGRSSPSTRLVRRPDEDEEDHGHRDHEGDQRRHGMSTKVVSDV